jgi:Protein of unknown function (DUF2442)
MWAVAPQGAQGMGMASDEVRGGVGRARADVRLWVEQLPEARAVEVTREELVVSLSDGRRLAVPLGWFPWLQGGTPEQRGQWELIADGIGIHWPALGEDVFVLDLCVPPATRVDGSRG